MAKITSDRVQRKGGRSKPPRKGGFGADARRIVIEYAKAVDGERDKPKAIGLRKISKSAVAPIDRADSVLMRGIYRLACEIRFAGTRAELIEYVRTRDVNAYRPRENSEIDWAVRLVNRHPMASMPKDLEDVYYNQDKGILLSPSQVTRLSTEMNYAFWHRIRWQFVDMFIRSVGGYELIAPCLYDRGEPYVSRNLTKLLSWTIDEELIKSRDWIFRNHRDKQVNLTIDDFSDTSTGDEDINRR